MTRWIMAAFAALALGGCAHQELTAPCEPVASLVAVDECGQERPLNVAGLTATATTGAG